MFTVRHQAPSGVVTLHTTCQVEYRKPDPSLPDDIAVVHMLVGPSEAGPGISCGAIRDGHVYVMNDKGQTVGHFICGKQPSQPK